MHVCGPFPGDCGVDIFVLFLVHVLSWKCLQAADTPGLELCMMCVSHGQTATCGARSGTVVEPALSPMGMGVVDGSGADGGGLLAGRWCVAAASAGRAVGGVSWPVVGWGLVEGWRVAVGC